MNFLQTAQFRNIFQEFSGILRNLRRLEEFAGVLKLKFPRSFENFQ
jgi:hypothetical protein